MHLVWLIEFDGRLDTDACAKSKIHQITRINHCFRNPSGSYLGHDYCESATLFKVHQEATWPALCMGLQVDGYGICFPDTNKEKRD